MNKICYSAVAGAGKTTSLINWGIDRYNNWVKNFDNKKIIYITYTLDNQSIILSKLQKEIKLIPAQIVVSGWYEFLLKSFVRPYKGDIIERLYDEPIGLNFITDSGKIKGTNNKFYSSYRAGDKEGKFLNTEGTKIKKDFLSEFAYKCIIKNKVKLKERFEIIYDTMYIDEAQDLSGYDFEILKFLIKETTINIIIVGDPRQKSYQTSIRTKYKNYDFYTFCEEKINTSKTNYIDVDNSTFSNTHRCIEDISKIASMVFPNMSTTKTCNCLDCLRKRNDFNGLKGVYWVYNRDVPNFIKQTNAITLTWDKRSNRPYGVSKSSNIGKSKGDEYDSVLLCPTKPFLKWFKSPMTEKLPPQSQAKLYIALTRAKYSVGIFVPDKFIPKNSIIKVYKPHI